MKHLFSNTFSLCLFHALNAARHRSQVDNATVRAAWLKTMCNAYKRLAFDFQELGVWSAESIPKGTRFGPLQGTIYAVDAVPDGINRKFLWRVSTASFEIKRFKKVTAVKTRTFIRSRNLTLQVYKDGRLSHCIDGLDPRRSNWMRYVNPARSAAQQNLVACQVQQDIYFYTVRSIPPESELLVWYSKEFLDRINSTDAIGHTSGEWNAKVPISLPKDFWRQGTW